MNHQSIPTRTRKTVTADRPNNELCKNVEAIRYGLQFAGMSLTLDVSCASEVSDSTADRAKNSSNSNGEYELLGSSPREQIHRGADLRRWRREMESFDHF